MEIKEQCHHPVCLYAHDLVNKLSAIVGRCDPSMEEAERSADRDKHVKIIREIAKSMCDALQSQLCQPDPVSQSISSPKALSESHPSGAPLPLSRSTQR
jgi:hypothetical protein